jgi:TolB-like protein
MTMLNTRLAWPEQVRVIPKRRITEILAGVSLQNRNKVIQDVSEQTGSRYVLDGSITQLAGSFSIDAVVYMTKGSTAMVAGLFESGSVCDVAPHAVRPAQATRHRVKKIRRTYFILAP